VSARTAKPIVGIDLGGTNMQIGIVDAARTLLGRAKRKTKPEEGLDAVIDRIASGVKEACDDAGLSIKDLGALGIGAPGAIEPKEGVVLEAVNLHWTDVRLADILEQKFGLPSVVDNDVNAAVYGENRLGSGNNARDLLGVWVGTGIGGGLIIDGRLYYGHHKTAGEVGHMILFPNNPPGYRSLEHNCSRTAVVDRLVRLIKGNRKSIVPTLVDGDLSAVKSKTVAKAYEMGDDLTVEIVDHTAELIGIHVAGIVTLLSLGRVVVGGGLTEALGRPFVERIQRFARINAFPAKCQEVDVVPSKLEDNAGVFGAVLIAAERLNGKRGGE